MRSIKTKWMLAIVILLITLIGAMIFVNNIFLEKYYIYKTKSVFINEYEELSIIYNNISNNEFLGIIKKQNSNTGYKYIVVNNKNDLILSSAPEFAEGDRIKLPKYLIDFVSENYRELRDDKPVYKALKTNSTNQYDITLAAKLSNDNILIITKPLKQVSENVDIANDFFIMIGIGILIVGVIIANQMSRRFVSPILEITQITSKIADLDFTERFYGTSKDEVGTLGESINRISTKLNSTINDLKYVNADLQKELQLQKRFLASVSHEFKNPVGLIRGYTESLHLGMAKNKEEAQEFTSIILQEVDHLNRLISDIIFLMHIDSGIFKMKMQKFNLNELIERVVKKFSSMPSEKDFEIISDLSFDEIIYGDSGRITQVLDNLISNAVRYVSNNGLLKISTIKHDNYVKIQVFNSGEQIPDQHLPYLFNPFYSTQDSRSRTQGGGTGLGLSIVKSIIKKHNGTCGVYNREDGVVFWFTLAL